MPRISKNRGNGNTFRGVSSHKVCIYSAVDELDNCVFKIEGLGSETIEKSENFKHFLEPNQENKYHLISDMKQVFKGLVSYTNLTHVEIKSNAHVSDDDFSLASINQLHDEFQKLYSLYRGVSIRHLQGYLNFFSFVKNVNYKIERIKEKNQNVYTTAYKEHVDLLERKICDLKFPIDLFAAYGEWHYGCFAI